MWLRYCNADLSYVGCFAEPIADFDKNKRLWTYYGDGSGTMTIEICKQWASARGYVYAALQFHSQCFGGNFIAAMFQNKSVCDTPCDGNSVQTCGGAWANSMYYAQRESNVESTQGRPCLLVKIGWCMCFPASKRCQQVSASHQCGAFPFIHAVANPSKQ